jgi:broad specificity phosphatase PhoE
VVVASHADMIRLITSAYLGLSLDLYQRISIAPASVTAVLLGKSPEACGGGAKPLGARTGVKGAGV